ncbi:MAG: PilZ domain-containing protein [Deltaproteobacteria bacterium]|nr:PilZ domain-containing protein [Deltaproteobacteria bacterium]
MEKRTSQRSEFPHMICFDLLAGKGNRYVNVPCRGMGIDISEGGIGLTFDRTLEKDKVIRVLLPVLGGGAEVPVFSVIRWSEAVGPQFRVGLQFLG